MKADIYFCTDTYCPGHAYKHSVCPVVYVGGQGTLAEPWGPKVTNDIKEQSGPAQVLPTDAAARDQYPMADGLLYYFPAALAEVARVSKVGNAQHNGDQPLHWNRNRSKDHANKILKHLVDAGTLDADGQRHTAKVAWRALALLQEELEREGLAPLARNARFGD